MEEPGLRQGDYAVTDAELRFWKLTLLLTTLVLYPGRTSRSPRESHQE
jgi:hypothetical protein